MAIDYSDLAGLDDLPVSPLPAARWVDFPRSGTLSPIYVERYAGRRETRNLTRHSFWELTWVADGRGCMVTEHTSYELHAEMLMLIPPRVPHMELSDTVMDTIWVGLIGQGTEGLPCEEPVSVEDPDCGVLAERLWMLASRPYGTPGMELDGLTYALVGRFKALLDNQREEKDDLVDRAVEYMQSHFVGQLAIPELADSLGCSEGHFYRVFKQKTGITPTQYLADIRINHARQLLHFTSMPIERVAHACGYPDALYFSRVFRKYVGLSPTGFRQNCDMHMLGT